MRRVLVAFLIALGIGGLFLFSACGGGGESEPESDGENGSAFNETINAKLAAALGLGGPESIVWEKETSSAWRDAQLFANRILGNAEAPSLDETQITVLEDDASGGARTVVVRVLVADVAADYRVSMQEVGGQWRVTGYEVEQIVEAMGR